MLSVGKFVTRAARSGESLFQKVKKTASQVQVDKIGGAIASFLDTAKGVGRALTLIPTLEDIDRDEDPSSYDQIEREIKSEIGDISKYTPPALKPFGYVLGSLTSLIMDVRRATHSSGARTTEGREVAKAEISTQTAHLQQQLAQQGILQSILSASTSETRHESLDLPAVIRIDPANLSFMRLITERELQYSLRSRAFFIPLGWGSYRNLDDTKKFGSGDRGSLTIVDLLNRQHPVSVIQTNLVVPVGTPISEFIGALGEPGEVITDVQFLKSTLNFQGRFIEIEPAEGTFQPPGTKIKGLIADVFDFFNTVVSLGISLLVGGGTENLSTSVSTVTGIPASLVSEMLTYATANAVKQLNSIQRANSEEITQALALSQKTLKPGPFTYTDRMIDLTPSSLLMQRTYVAGRHITMNQDGIPSIDGTDMSPYFDDMQEPEVASFKSKSRVNVAAGSIFAGEEVKRRWRGFVTTGRVTQDTCLWHETFQDTSAFTAIEGLLGGTIVTLADTLSVFVDGRCYASRPDVSTDWTIKPDDVDFFDGRMLLRSGLSSTVRPDYVPRSNVPLAGYGSRE
jgi:hypothetical protein